MILLRSILLILVIHVNLVNRLPAGFYYSRYLSLGGQFSKADSAHVKISHIAGFTAAFPTAPDYPGGEFGLLPASQRFCNLCLCGHRILRSTNVYELTKVNRFRTFVPVRIS